MTWESRKKKSIRKHPLRMNTNDRYISSDWGFGERWKELAMNWLGLSWKEMLRAGLTWKSKERGKVERQLSETEAEKTHQSAGSSSWEEM